MPLLLENPILSPEGAGRVTGFPIGYIIRFNRSQDSSGNHRSFTAPYLPFGIKTAFEQILFWPTQAFI